MSEYMVKPLDPDTWDTFASAPFPYIGTRTLVEQAGFDFGRAKGTKTA